MGGGGAPVALRKMKVRAWQTVSTMEGTMAMMFLTTSDREKSPRYMKEGVILIGIPSNRGGTVRAAHTVYV